MAVIGLVGFIGSGKGTAGDILMRDCGYKKFAFADSLKDAVSSIFLWPRGLLEGDSEASRQFREQVDPWWSKRLGYEVTPRLILQKFGTEACRNNIADNIWIAALEKRIQGYQDVVITDVRFPNEIEFVRSAGGKIIRIKRGPEPEWYNDAIFWNKMEGESPNLKNTMKERNIHPSEYKWVGEHLDTTIENEGTVDELKEKIISTLTTFEKQTIIQHHPV